jgi:serine/threonine protein kinase
MAPETLQDQATTKMVDYWSLGIIMYELIYACLPWGPCESSDCVDLFFNIITKPVPLTHEVRGVSVSSDEGKTEGDAVVHIQLRRRCRRVYTAATDLIIGLLEKDPADRTGADEAGIKAHTKVVSSVVTKRPDMAQTKYNSTTQASKTL